MLKVWTWSYVSNALFFSGILLFLLWKPIKHLSMTTKFLTKQLSEVNGIKFCLYRADIVFRRSLDCNNKWKYLKTQWTIFIKHFRPSDHYFIWFLFSILSSLLLRLWVFQYNGSIQFSIALIDYKKVFFLNWWSFINIFVKVRRTFQFQLKGD